jgi:hypothetical protein
MTKKVTKKEQRLNDNDKMKSIMRTATNCYRFLLNNKKL